MIHAAISYVYMPQIYMYIYVCVCIYLNICHTPHRLAVNAYIHTAYVVIYIPHFCTDNISIKTCHLSAHGTLEQFDTQKHPQTSS